MSGQAVERKAESCFVCTANDSVGLLKVSFCVLMTWKAICYSANDQSAYKSESNFLLHAFPVECYEMDHTCDLVVVSSL